VLREKKMVLPSGENVGEPGFAGPDTTPGAKICGEGACAKISGAKNEKSRNHQILLADMKSPVQLDGRNAFRKACWEAGFKQKSEFRGERGLFRFVQVMAGAKGMPQALKRGPNFDD
jgi:hypothetical protein